MNIVIPLAGRVRMCIRSSFVVAQRTDAIHFNLTGDSFNLMQVTSDQVFVLPDEIEISEGQEMTDDLITHADRVAVMRGPVVYCAEEADNPGIPSEYFHADKTLQKSLELTAKYEPDLLEGVVTIEGEGVKLVPYFAWDNRAPGAMAVWLRETE